ncbi:hypothetical protein [Arthrobacter sp. 92]|uniref:hypothetical protein n=1 Tax=Arthrobacter sp. 92 TaxID=3418175 RepID=UPI003D063A44
MESTPPRRPAKAALIAAGLLALLPGSVTGCSSPAPASSLPLTRVQDIALPGAASRLDYQALDEAGKRLYIAHLGDGTVHAVVWPRARWRGPCREHPRCTGSPSRPTGIFSWPRSRERTWWRSSTPAP